MLPPSSLAVRAALVQSGPSVGAEIVDRRGLQVRVGPTDLELDGAVADSKADHGGFCVGPFCRERFDHGPHQFFDGGP
jgi:hypothetical protein